MSAEVLLTKLAQSVGQFAGEEWEDHPAGRHVISAVRVTEKYVEATDGTIVMRVPVTRDSKNRFPRTDTIFADRDPSTEFLVNLNARLLLKLVRFVDENSGPGVRVIEFRFPKPQDGKPVEDMIKFRLAGADERQCMEGVLMPCKSPRANERKGPQPVLSRPVPKSARDKKKPRR